MKRRDRPGWLLSTSMIVVAFLLVAPTLVLIPMSFSSGKSFAFPPPGWSLQWYRSIVQDPDWRGSVLTSLKLALTVAPLATILGTAAAFGLTRCGRRRRAFLKGTLIIPLIIPHILIAIAVYGAFLNLHLSGTFQGLVAIDTVLMLPYVVLSVGARLEAHDPRLRDAALSLGASRFVAFTRVTFPLVLPGIVAGFLLALIQTFDEFIIALFLQGPSFKPFSIQLYNSVALEVDPTISAASTLLVLIVSAVIVISQLLVTRPRGHRDHR